MVVSIWRIDLCEADRTDPDYRGLDAEEIRQASRFRDAKHARRWAYTHSAMRSILAHHLQADPSDIVYYTDQAGGKPRARLHATNLPDFDFNLTHSGDWAWLAVADSRGVGIDLEHISPSVDWRSLLDTVCTPLETRAVLEQPEGLHAEQFYRTWVRKESLLKSIGVGLVTDQPLQTIDTLQPSASILQSGPWWLFDLPAPPGYAAALTVSNPQPQLTWHTWVPADS